jgi:methionyl-tRNA formyltransferase
VRIVFAGTPEPALTALRVVADSRHEVIAVLSRPDVAQGRGRTVAASPVSDWAGAEGVELLTPRRPSDPAFVTRLTELAPDCCAIVAYGGLIPPAVLAIPAHGWVNLHFSLLPAWRGAAPVQHALLAGDDVTGASTFRLEAGLDTGPVYGTVTEPIAPTDTAGTLLSRLSVTGAELLVATLDAIEDGTARAVPQPADGVSSAPKISVDDARIDWTAPAFAVDRRIRGCTPEPGAWTTFGAERVGVGPATVIDPDLPADEPLEPGELRIGRRDVLVGTGTTPVRLGLVRPAGRREMPAADWARGLRRPADMPPVFGR